ncbi:MAG: DNA repair protein RadA [Thermomicrobiales bacterium]
MAKRKTSYVCQQCGFTNPAFFGRCPECNEWNSMVEVVEAPVSSTSGNVKRLEPARVQALSDVGSANLDRISVPIEEFDRVLGGGLVRGSLILLGGDPGIGKSTLVLQTAAGLASAERKVLYVSGEESAQQIKLRADRLGVPGEHLLVLSETNLQVALDAAEETKPGLLIIDSIQTAYLDDLNSAAGSVSQVRECTARLMQWAKPRNIPVLIVGHVTKEGAIAGPRVLEHMVDVVLYLEGERHHHYRILRGVKNRFGSTDEVGVFEMADAGLREVRNPSEAFLEERSGNSAGSTVAVTMEGTRPILVEVQALSSTTAFGLPRRSGNGLDANRLQLLVAVLQKRVGLPLQGQDIYANVVGGLKIAEPAADLPLTLAIASSFRDRAVDPRLVAIGELGLSGEVRSVNHLERRLIEARRLGFTRAIIPANLGRRSGSFGEGLELIRVSTLQEALQAALG